MESPSPSSKELHCTHSANQRVIHIARETSPKPHSQDTLHQSQCLSVKQLAFTLLATTSQQSTSSPILQCINEPSTKPSSIPSLALHNVQDPRLFANEKCLPPLKPSKAATKNRHKTQSNMQRRANCQPANPPFSQTTLAPPHFANSIKLKNAKQREKQEGQNQHPNSLTPFLNPRPLALPASLAIQGMKDTKCQ